jgi:hypothetical protein
VIDKSSIFGQIQKNRGVAPEEQKDYKLYKNSLEIGRINP